MSESRIPCESLTPCARPARWRLRWKNESGDDCAGDYCTADTQVLKEHLRTRKVAFTQTAIEGGEKP